MFTEPDYTSGSYFEWLRPSKSYDKLLAKIGLSALRRLTFVLCLVPLRASESVSNSYITDSDKVFLFQGQYYDHETELAYNRFRYYSPELGRYISEDPIRLESGECNLLATWRIPRYC